MEEKKSECLGQALQIEEEQRERERALVAFFSSDIISSTFLFVSCEEVIVSFLHLEASK